MILTIILCFCFDFRGIWISKEFILALTFICLITLSDVLALTYWLSFFFHYLGNLLNLFVFLFNVTFICRILDFANYCICFLFLTIIFILRLPLIVDVV